MEQFKEKLLDAFEVSSINENDVIKDFDSWDSLTLLTVIATIDSEFGFQMNASDFDKIITISDLFDFISKNKK
ncbi:MAG: phosphopantetheine-binding protein [Flavobacteriaceae bacterium]|nr:phosphopantetheine-binding protein [Flavobacteriaceae bacterium]